MLGNGGVLPDHRNSEQGNMNLNLDAQSNLPIIAHELPLAMGQSGQTMHSSGLSEMEPTTKSGTKRKRTQCGKCGEEGHNSRTCKVEYCAIAMSSSGEIGDPSGVGEVNGKMGRRSKKDKKKPSMRKIEKDRPWPSLKTRQAAKAHYPSKLPERRPCTWCFNRRCGQKRLTKYHCDPCKVDLCAAPCFKEFHNEGKKV
mmetsp:Transcript_22557/g.30993  ORF Transcript_22557/g.30993 Transcript_22557/m.30993 type:complete len:198 (-) Transcript_22557:185-778(-)